MRRLTPRTISAAIFLAFAALLGFRHLTFVASSQLSVSPEDVDLLDRLVPFVAWSERVDYDFNLRRLVRRVNLEPDPRVVVVEIEERSLAELGQFPFPRRVYKQFLERLQGAGAKVVAFDITFPEEEQNRTLSELRQVQEELRRQGQGAAAGALGARLGALDGDRTFAEAITQAKLPVVMGFSFANPKEGDLDRKIDLDPALDPHQIYFINSRPTKGITSVEGRRPARPHDTLMRAIQGQNYLGSFDSDPDEDSVIRRAQVAITDGARFFPSLATRGLASYLGVKPALTVREGQLFLTEEEGSGKLSAPLLPNGNIYLRYYGGRRQFPYIEFSDVHAGRPEALAQVKDKIVLVGATASGLKDLRANPFDKDYPGVEVHATLASNILAGHLLAKDGRYFLWGYAFLLVLVVGVSLLVHRIHPALAFLGLVALAMGLQFLAQRLFASGVVVPTLLPTLAGAVTLFTGVVYRYLTEESEKKVVRAAFSRYVSGAVVEEILRDPAKLSLGGQKKVLTVMFCDLVGFTKLSEQMDAHSLTQRLNEYFTRMTRLVLKNQGTLDKYMGDAIMCFWGAPLDIPAHASLACRTALEMVAELDAINREWQEKYGITIGLRIGVHTGEVAVGNMGSEQVFSYTVMGDNVNLASRLEGVNNVYGTRILVSAATAAAAGPEFRFRELDSVRVKGKEEAVVILELLSGSGQDLAFAEALAAYRAGDWARAQVGFAQCLEKDKGCAPAAAMLERMKELGGKAPAGWNGTWTLLSK